MKMGEEEGYGEVGRENNKQTKQSKAKQANW